jgi:hypothetical protein
MLGSHVFVHLFSTAQELKQEQVPTAGTFMRLQINHKIQVQELLPPSTSTPGTYTVLPIPHS